jgi:tryptophan-rich sensory protein
MRLIIKKYLFEIVGALFCLSLGRISGLIAHAGDTVWYQSLIKPTITPPAWIFGPVWTILYILMGIALGKIIKIKNDHDLRILFAIQFLCNIIWSYLFFRMHKIDFALYDLMLLWAILIALLIKTHKHKIIFLLLLPYFIWTTFAYILNLQFFLFNS